jgi:hypothetical protein
VNGVRVTPGYSRKSAEPRGASDAVKRGKLRYERKSAKRGEDVISYITATRGLKLLTSTCNCSLFGESLATLYRHIRIVIMHVTSDDTPITHSVLVISHTTSEFSQSSSAIIIKVVRVGTMHMNMAMNSLTDHSRIWCNSSRLHRAGDLCVALGFWMEAYGHYSTRPRTVIVI